MLDLALDVGDPVTGIACVRRAGEVLGDGTELYDEVARQVFRPTFASLFAPEPDKGGFVAAHDDAGVRATHKKTTRVSIQRGAHLRSPLHIEIIETYIIYVLTCQ